MGEFFFMDEYFNINECNLSDTIVIFFTTIIFHHLTIFITITFSQLTHHSQFLTSSLQMLDIRLCSIWGEHVENTTEKIFHEFRGMFYLCSVIYLG